MTVLFAVVGIYQEVARHVFWNPKVIVGNAYQSFFRVNSLFWDPSIYGRFLVIAILASLVVGRWSRSARTVWIVAGVIGLAWVGMLFSYSQTSFASLLVGVLVAGALLAPTFRRRGVSVAILLLVGSLVLVRPAAAPALPVDAPLADVTSGRGRLIKEGIAPRRACHVAVTWGITDDPQVQRSLDEVVAAIFP